MNDNQTGFFGGGVRANDDANTPQTSYAVTASDTVDLKPQCLGIWVGTGGTLAVRMMNDSASTILKNVADGTFLPGAFKRIMVTGTVTCADIVSFHR